MDQPKWNMDTIRSARKAAKLTQAGLAEQLGCRQQTISEWELGMYAPKNAYQQLITLFFNSFERAAVAKAAEREAMRDTALAADYPR